MRSSRLPWWTLLPLLACAPSAESAKLDDFVTNGAKVIADACKGENDGKRYLLEGHVVPHTEASVSDGLVHMDMYATIDAKGEGVGGAAWLTFKHGEHVTLAPGGQAAGVKLHTPTGDASATDRLQVIVDLVVKHRFQNGRAAGCELRVVELRKLAPA